MISFFYCLILSHFLFFFDKLSIFLNLMTSGREIYIKQRALEMCILMPRLINSQGYSIIDVQLYRFDIKFDFNILGMSGLG